MKDNSQLDCYGHLFPDLLKNRGGTTEGHAFRCVIGKTCAFGSPTLAVEVKDDEWEACTKCPRFDACYKLSLGKLELQKALLDRN
tara:strand:+ start:148 stop:402 length:255 start_codon:yes stop_codon:yes gene_type:complete